MIKIQEEDFNSEKEIEDIKKLYSNIGASTSFIGYVRDKNNKESKVKMATFRLFNYSSLWKTKCK